MQYGGTCCPIPAQVVPSCLMFFLAILGDGTHLCHFLRLAMFSHGTCCPNPVQGNPSYLMFFLATFILSFLGIRGTFPQIRLLRLRAFLPSKLLLAVVNFFALNVFFSGRFSGMCFAFVNPLSSFFLSRVNFNCQSRWVSLHGCNIASLEEADGPPDNWSVYRLNVPGASHWITNFELEMRAVKPHSTEARRRASVELEFVLQWIDSQPLFKLQWNLKSI